MTGEIVRAALVQALHDKHQKIAERITTAWLHVPEQRFLAFVVNAGWHSARGTILHPTPTSISNELLAQICEEYADFVTSRRPRRVMESQQSSTTI